MRLQSKRITETDGIIPHIAVEIDTTCQANRVFANESLQGRRVIPAAIKIESRPSFSLPVNCEELLLAAPLTVVFPNGS